MKTRDEDSIILNDNQSHYMIHPGEILREELKERGIKQKDLAKGIGMEPPHLSALIHGNRNITAAIAAKLESVLNIPASVWLNLQNQYNVGKSRMRNNHTSSVVDGYSKMSSPCVVLGEQETDYYGDRKIIEISLKKTDLPLFYSLASRLGWEIVK